MILEVSRILAGENGRYRGEGGTRSGPWGWVPGTSHVQGRTDSSLLIDSTQGLAKLVKVGKEAIEPPIPTAFGVGTQAVSPGGRLLFGHKVTSDSW